MRIAIVSARFFPVIGGGETYSYQLVSSLAKRGHKVTLITDASTTIKDEDVGFDVIRIEGFNDLEPHALKIIPELHKAFRENRFDVVQILNIIPYFFVMNSLPKNYGAKIVVSINNTPNPPQTVFGQFHDYKSELDFLNRLFSTLPPDLVHCGSEYFKQNLQSLLPSGIPIKLIPFGVDLKSYSQAQHKTRPESSEYLIICTSRFVYRKGLPNLIKAMEFLPSTFRLLLTGAVKPEGKETFDHVQKLIHVHRLEDRVIFADHQLTYEEMPHLYALADVFVIPSSFEGFGIATIEAMASRTPVVATNVPGTRDLVENGKTGLLSEYGDTKQLASNIERAVNDKVLRERLIDNAFKFIAANHDLELSVNKHEKLYQDLVDTQKALLI